MKNDISIVEELDQTGSNRNTAVSVMLPCTLQFNFIPFLFNDDSIFCHRLLYREPCAFEKSQKILESHYYMQIYLLELCFVLFSFDHSKIAGVQLLANFCTLVMTENGRLDQITISTQTKQEIQATFTNIN